MKVFILLWIGLFSICYANAQQVITGQVADQSGRPIPFANVLILAATDSALVTGGVTDESGAFRLEAGPSAGLLKVSFIGFEDKYLPLTSGQANLGTITLREATEALAEVVVKGDRPVTRLKGDALVTTVENSLLAQVGSANDVLERVPGITRKSNDVLEVLGKGKPIIYINGRLIRDNTELEQLSSGEIASVELVTNPGARYDATAKAVVRIRTVRRQGDGFGLNARSSWYQSEHNTDLVEQLGLNYRHDNLDLFATLYYFHNDSYTAGTNYAETYDGTSVWRQPGSTRRDMLYQITRGTFGFDYLLAENHSVGARYIVGYNWSEANQYFDLEVTRDAESYDRMSSYRHEESDNKPDHRLNLYYNGKAGNVGIDLNADYYKEKKRSLASTDEDSQDRDDRLVRTINPVDNQLVAAKLVFTLPLGGGELSWGGEYTHTTRTDNYLSETEGYVPTSYSEIKEDNTAVFAEYGRSLPFGSFTAGLRYEHVAFDYWKNHTYMGEQSRTYDNLFPTVGLNAKAGPVRASLSYATKVDRPSYDALSNNLAYYSRYLVVQGDPTLRPSVTHDLTLASTWRFLQLMVSYQHQKDVILEWLSPWTEEPGALYARKINSGKVPQVSAFLSASPKIGLWSPSWTVGVVRNWFSIDGDFLSYKSDRPIWSASLNNSLRLFWGLTLDANFVYQSKGKIYHVRYDRPVYALNVALRKSFLNDALSVELRGNDLFDNQRTAFTNFGTNTLRSQLEDYDSREFRLTLRYKFNATKSRYKGTGAGKDAINRL